MSRGVIDSSLATIGDTPVVRLHRIVPDGSAQVLVKIEAGNPTGSYKDRIALAIIEEAERSDRDSASWSTPAEAQAPLSPTCAQSRDTRAPS
ncbi:hypothetical protein GCM10022275_31650 [Tessaracoccus defluvii]